jgi:uncharacterized membrane protein
MNKVKEFIKKEWIILLLILLSYGFGLYFAPILPERIPTHWNISGQIDGYGPKIMGVIGFPSITLGIYILMLVLPLIDPKRKNYNLFDGVYKLIRWFLVVFFVIMHIVTIFAALGYNIYMDKIIIVLIGILFIGLGNYFGKVRQNWFLGIRTPWTLSDEDIWNKTHRLGGKVWVITGFAIIILSFISPILAFVFLMIAMLIPVIYSYLLFKKKQNNK